ncbi:MAG: hypothetical protein COA41_07330 [Sphingopyxis sp.]|nr:MAG: hypothetical protein COA41_07330 [Sphingopyxis sp.]
MRAIFKLGIIISAGLLTTPSQADCTNNCINVGSFNIKMFGNGNFPAKSDKSIEELVERIDSKANLDVVALQEVNINSSDWRDRLLPALQDKGYELTGTGTYGGESSTRQQFVVLMHRKHKINAIDPATEVSQSNSYSGNGMCNYTGIRSPLTAYYGARSGSFDFRVYAVHLKSKLPVGGAPESCDDEIRRHQLNLIGTAIKERRKSSDERDFLVLGDFNASYGDPELQPLKDAGLNSLHTGTCNKNTLQGCSHVNRNRRYRDLIDFIYASGDVSEYIPHSAQVMQISDVRRYNREQSDHVPIWASFDIGEKDDD